LFGTYPELINWNLDKQQETNLSDDGSTVFQSTMSLLLQMNKPKPDQELEQEHKQKLGSKTSIWKRRRDQVYFKLTLNPRTSMVQEF
jgi:hypothetical protein